MGGPFTVSDTFGSRDGAHRGIDFAAPIGTPILAAAPGRVVAAGTASGFGHWIVVDSVDARRQMFSTVYGHMFADGLLVRVGDTVAAGQRIASVGSDGESSGPHLHFEVVPGGRFTGGRQIDPGPWLAGAPMTADQLPMPGDPGCDNGFGSPGGNLAPGRVPDELVVWYRRAGSLCPQIAPSLLAAQGRQESGFRRGLISPAGAQGLAQFLPSTARQPAPDGQPYVIDADGNGVASVWDDGDAIVGQGRYMCALAAQIDAWRAQGRVRGDTTSLTLAAYNAGEGAVLASGGLPNQVPGHYSETQPYVRAIEAAEPGFRSPGGSGRFEPVDGDLGGQIVLAGRQWLGAPYVFGGGGPQGPTAVGAGPPGFDAAGFTAAAVSAASSGTVTLPQTAEQQWLVGTEIAAEQARPGDLVFTRFGPAGPAQVAILVGDGRVLQAQQGSGVVEIAPAPDARLRRVG
ncbi:peptidoglycan DD-metalloendopeptidase family protein [Skermania piniformis]|uniref:Peptidoglycan DD-metalloendopeptidase family protein n=2 Tax=Skermania pinensis TaxID=39122 RepID=A0ABX8SD06_9ACTN|nr:peptidoglycan DD-metalloendopeptidase family protein [Skermania piniformis]